MSCVFPDCGCDLPPDEPEATARDLSALVTAYLAKGGKITKCRPGKKSSSSARSLEVMKTPYVNPNAFVWTKIQAEAGQSIKRILNRKELERQASDGTFWWGIGESRSRKFDLLLQIK